MRIRLQKSEIYLARKVICEGVEYGLSLVSFTDDGIHIRKFEEETPSTVYVDGVIIVEAGCNGPELVQVI